MIDDLTAQQIRRYRDDGFLVLHDFLDAAELERWRRAVDEGVARQLGNSQPEIKVFDNQQRGQRNEAVFVQCVNMWKVSAPIRELVLSARLGRLAADLAGVDGVRLYHDHVLIKNPWASPTTWHTDNPGDPYFSHQSIMLWLALDDATLRNGCLYVPARLPQVGPLRDRQRDQPCTDRRAVRHLLPSGGRSSRSRWRCAPARRCF